MVSAALRSAARGPSAPARPRHPHGAGKVPSGPPGPRLDLVLAEEYPGNPQRRPAELEQRDLLDDPLHLALPPSAGGPTTELRQLADHPWVMELEGTPARHWALSVCRDAGFEPDVRFETTDLLLHLRLVEEGLAAAFLPDLVLDGQPVTAELRQLPAGRRVFTVVRRGRGGHPAVVACRDALRRAVALRTDRSREDRP
ncbi:LysR substrate-binding domain-containing protein [Streptomyces sp. Ag109_O5-1]|uniref:LysR substrate-binding domain-containing protein n=1 Tax=Streptomyces sp. Ag109_O5-1 TaxID=1938851 RepID=UPI0037D9FC0C